ncbi:MAG: hypothetical protein ISP90_16060 [Nevskia sp.]|nr:hypothetical protein [Nevskia sp.]
MNALALVAAIERVAEGTHAGFVYVSVACVGALWLLYRATISRIARLELAVAECNKRHTETEKALAAANQRAENLGRSLTALWTIISLGAAGRTVRLPPLHELLEGNIRLDAEEGKGPRQAAA